MIKQKLKAAGLHFLLSVAVVTLVATLCWLLWFPSWVFLNDFFEGFKLIAVVDVVLGPLLTMVVYNTAKSSLKFDLAAIVLVQLAALGYGVSVVYSQRPVVQVVYFDGIAAYRSADIEGWKDLPSTQKVSGVATYFLDIPPDAGSYQALKMTYEIMGEEISQNLKLYEPIEKLESSLAELYLPAEKYNAEKDCYSLDFEFRAATTEYCFKFP